MKNTSTERVNELTAISDGTLATCIKQAQKFDDIQNPSHYNTLNQIRSEWRDFVAQTVNKNYQSWQDAWKEFIG